MANWGDRFRTLFHIRRREHEPVAEIGATDDLTEAFGGELTPNIRALRLALTVCDALVAMGIASSSVVSRALDITEAYCDRPVHIDVSANLITLSQIRGLKKEPLALIRPVVTRGINNMTIQSIQDLVYRISKGEVKLAEAETELDQILKHPVRYPPWLIPVANASLAAGVVLMFTTNWRIVLMTFAIVWLVDRLIARLYKRSVPAFFRQVAAAACVTLAAAVISWLGRSGIDFFDGTNPTIIVVGGIIMLVAGLAIVGGIQDAIDEYYLTANAKILKVVMLTSGIVMGILIGLYIANRVGIGIAVSPDPLQLTAFPFQIAGGAIAAGAFAVATQTRLRAVIWAGLIGALAILVMYAARDTGVSIVPATGMAALVIGTLAKLLSRRWHTPASGIIAAGIVPLVPGLSLYNGLMQLVTYPPGDPLFYRGLGTLFTAAGIALAIAAGASFGYIIARPLRQRHTYIRNLMPFASLMRAQLNFEHRSRLARMLLGKHSMERWHEDSTKE